VSIGGKVTTFTVNGLPTDAYGINSSGATVGFFVTANAQRTYGYLRDAAGNITVMNFPAAIASGCTGINDAGVITGFYMDKSGGTHGFIYVNGKYLSSTLPYIAQANNKGEYVGSLAGKSGQTLGFLARGAQ
jgi:hypothetical protein